MAGNTPTAPPESLPHASAQRTAARAHHPDPAPTYRVTIDVARIQANVFACEGGRLSELAVRTWLRSVGFTPEHGPAADAAAEGSTWLADADSLCRLDKSEIVHAERVTTG